MSQFPFPPIPRPRSEQPHLPLQHLPGVSPALGLRGCHPPEKPLLCWGCKAGKGDGLRELLSGLRGTGQGGMGCAPMGIPALGWKTELLPQHEPFMRLREWKTQGVEMRQIRVGSPDGWGEQEDAAREAVLEADPRLRSLSPSITTRELTRRPKSPASLQVFTQMNPTPAALSVSH